MVKKSFILILAMMLFLSGCSFHENGSSNDITSFLFLTDGTKVSEDGSIRMHTALEDNRFSYITLQLWTDVPSLHIMNISTATEGKQTGLYMHKLETGYYIIRLKANSNEKDESAFARVMLIKGRSYTYSYNIEELGEKSALISGFKFKMN